MYSHRAIPACTVPKAPKTTETISVRQCHKRLSPLARRCTSPTSQHVSCQCFAISRTADINKKTSVCLPISETDVWTIGFDLPGSGDGGIPHHSNVIRLHKPIRMMPVPSALHWNPKMATNISVNDGCHLIVSISVVRRCQSTKACHNVVDCFQAYTAHAASRTDITM